MNFICFFCELGIIIFVMVGLLDDYMRYYIYTIVLIVWCIVGVYEMVVVFIIIDLFL